MNVPIRTAEPSDAAFIVEMARLASAVEGRPPPPADDPRLTQGLPPFPDASVLALNADGHRVGAAWWHFREPVLVVTPDGVPVPELVVAVLPADRGSGVGRRLLDALIACAAEHGYERLALNVDIRNPPALTPAINACHPAAVCRTTRSRCWTGYGEQYPAPDSTSSPAVRG